MTADEMMRELLYEANLETLSEGIEEFVRGLDEYRKLNGGLTPRQEKALEKIYNEVFR